MVTYLSDAWIHAADAAVRADLDLAASTSAIDLVIEQTVSDGPEGDRTYHVRLQQGVVRVTGGPAPDADITFATDWATAAAIATGTASAQSAFMAGRLRLGGDTRTLVTHSAALADLTDALAPLRADTDFDR